MSGESEKFEAFGLDDWWGEKGSLASLHRINPLRFKYFQHVAGRLAHKSVLDVGCGGGILAESFASEDALVTGIDLSPVAIDAAKKHAEINGLKIDYRVVAVSEIAKESPGAFDIVVCAEVLEHVDDLSGFLTDALKALKPGGLFFFGTINRTVRARLLAVFVAENVLGMVPKGTHDPKRFVRPSELKRILDENNVEMMELKGLSYDPLRLDFRISKDTSVNYLGYAKKR